MTCIKKLFYLFVKFEALRAVTMKNAVLWDVTPCCPVEVLPVSLCHVPENNTTYLSVYFILAIAVTYRVCEILNHEIKSHDFI
jgi:hypothetical protein